MKKLRTILTLSTIALIMGVQGVPISAQDMAESKEASYSEENQTSFTLGKARSGYTYTLKRGSFLLWSKDIVSFNTRSNKITSSYGDQDWGWIFPNYIEGKGIRKVSSNSSQHTYAGKKYITAGIPTPWGAIGPFGKTVTDHLRVYSSGNATWW